MWIVDIGFALVVATLLAFLVRTVNRRHEESDAPAWPSLAFLVVILFFVTWAGGIWLRPLGPILWRVYWIPFVAVGVVAALLLVAATPRRRPHNRREALQARAQERALETAFGVFFWILVAVLLIAVTARYFL
jgi:cytochrome c oxidase assembly factor CtaG